MVDYRIGISCFIRINYVNKSQLIDVCKTYIIMQLLMISRSVKVSLLIKKSDFLIVIGVGNLMYKCCFGCISVDQNIFIFPL
jgi:hypothetical protein